MTLVEELRTRLDGAKESHDKLVEESDLAAENVNKSFVDEFKYYVIQRELETSLGYQKGLLEALTLAMTYERSNTTNDLQ